MSIIDQLRMERLRQRLPQYALAARLGVSQPTISAWERGTNQPTLPRLRQWARALGVRVVVTVTGGGDGASEQPEA